MANEFSQTVQKAIGLLSVIRENDADMDFTAIHRASGLGKTVCFRLLATLQHEGMVAKDAETNRYTIGPKVIELAGNALDRNALRVQANKVMRVLAHETGDAIMLFIPYGMDALCVDRMDGDAPVRPAGVDIGGKLPLHTGGAPFAILSHLRPPEQEQVLGGVLEAPTTKTVLDGAALREKMVEVRRNGYAVGDGDAIEHILAIGAPIFGPGERLLGAISVGGIKARYKAGRIRSMIPRVLDAADEISRSLGGHSLVRRPRP